MTTAEEVIKHYARIGKPIPDSVASTLGINNASLEAVKRPVKRKYGNIPTVYKGRQYDSIKEANRASELDMLICAKEIMAWLPQVEFQLPGKTKYIADFVILHTDGTYHVEDVKSESTRNDKVYRLKKRQIKDLYGFDIEEV